MRHISWTFILDVIRTGDWDILLEKYEGGFVWVFFSLAVLKNNKNCSLYNFKSVKGEALQDSVTQECV